jgi:hypothetical protein
VETLASGRAIRRAYKRAYISSQQAASSGRTPTLLEPAHLSQRRNALARRAFEAAGSWLGFAAASLINLLGPDTITVVLPAPSIAAVLHAVRRLTPWPVSAPGRDVPGQRSLRAKSLPGEPWATTAMLAGVSVTTPHTEQYTVGSWIRGLRRRRAQKTRKRCGAPARLADSVYWQANAVHEASHAVVGAAVGLTLLHATVAEDRSVRMGGQVLFSGPGDAQLFAVWLTAGAVGQTRWLRAAGYVHPELRRCVRDMVGSGDRAEADRIAADGFIIDLWRARDDASRLLGAPEMWAAVEQTAQLLLARRRLASADVAAVLDAHGITTQQVWTPGMGLPDS